MALILNPPMHRTISRDGNSSSVDGAPAFGYGGVVSACSIVGRVVVVVKATVNAFPGPGAAYPWDGWLARPPASERTIGKRCVAQHVFPSHRGPPAEHDLVITRCRFEVISGCRRRSSNGRWLLRLSTEGEAMFTDGDDDNDRTINEKEVRAVATALLLAVHGPDCDEREDRPRFFARGYCVFNVTQVDGYAPPDLPRLPESERIARADAFFAVMNIPVITGGNEACYRYRYGLHASVRAL
jgi:hypothetical protein